MQVMRQRGIQGDWPAPWAVRGKTAQQPDHRVLVIQQLWRGWGATAGSTKIKRRGRDNEGGTDWHKHYWEVGATQLQGELREAEMVRATGHLLQGRRVLASHSESRRRGK